MKIYVSHSRSFDFRSELYQPLRLINGIEWVFPHETSEQTYPVLELIRSGTLNLIIAEVSYPSTGQGIELGWAFLEGIPIICVYRSGLTPGASLRAILKEFLEYSGHEDLINMIENRLKTGIGKEGLL
ncbi:MAG: hypothetical protein AB1585_02665 [Thermodesulfobacteriota bacterium]